MKKEEDTQKTKNTSRKINKTILVAAILGILSFGGVFWHSLDQPPEDRLDKGIISSFFEKNAPEVEASSIDFESLKLSANAPIEITFTQKMNKESLEQAFKIEPEIQGELKTEERKLVFVPSKNLKLGDNYLVTIDKTAKNLSNMELGHNFAINFEVVESPKVLLVVPENQATKKDRITVAFDRPMIPLKMPSEITREDFPIKIEPNIEGKYRWVGTSSFQITPSEDLKCSTKYSLEIPKDAKSTDGGILKEGKAWEFSTPRIKIDGASTKIEGDEDFEIHFTEQVDLESLEGKIKLFKTGELKEKEAVLENKPIKSYSKSTYTSEVSSDLKEELKEDYINFESEENIPYKISYATYKEQVFDDEGNPKKDENEELVFEEKEDKEKILISPKDEIFGYGFKYRLDIDSGYGCIGGNLLSEEEFSREFATDEFVEIAINDAHNFNPKGEIQFIFRSDVDLNSANSSITIQPESSFSLKYKEYCKEDSKEKDVENCEKEKDKSQVIMKFNSLEKNKEYTVFVSNSLKDLKGNNPIRKKVSKKILVAGEPKILGVGKRTNYYNNTNYFIENYKSLCIYTNNRFNRKDLEENLTFNPAPLREAKISMICQNNQTCGCENIPTEANFVYSATLYLSPNEDYEVWLPKGTKDAYGQETEEESKFTFRTVTLNKNDTNISSAQYNDFLLMPENSDRNFVFTTMNLKNVDFSLCRLSEEKYIQVLERKRKDYQYNFIPNNTDCELLVNKNIGIDSIFWKREYNEISLSEFLGEEYRPGIYYLYIKSDYNDSIRRYLNITNTHVAIKSSPMNKIIWANTIDKGKTQNNLKINFYKYNYDLSSYSKILEETTNQDGILHKDIDEDFYYDLAVASKDEDITIFKPYDSDGIQRWDFGLESGYGSQEFVGIVYADRPIYRPLHKVFFKGIIREDEGDIEYKIPQGEKAFITINDATGKKLLEEEKEISINGTFSGELSLSEDASLGIYQILTCIGSVKDDCRNYISGSFRVEEYVAPEKKVEIESPRVNYFNGEELKAKVVSSYYFGAPVSEGKVDWKIRRQNYFFDKYEGEYFSFSEDESSRWCYWGCSADDEFVDSGSGTLDKKGELEITHKLSLEEKSEDKEEVKTKESQIYTVSVTVLDENNRSVSSQKEFIVHKGKLYVGVKTLDYFVPKGENVKIKTIAVDPDGNPLSGEKIDLRLIKRDWQSIKKKGVDGEFYFRSEYIEKDMGSVQVKTDSSGITEGEIEVSEGGSYRVVASTKDEDSREIKSSTYFYATDSDYIGWKREDNNRMEIVPEKPSYNLGETAKILIKSPYKDAQALITQERSKILDYKIQKIDSNSQILEIPITDTHIPNFFVSVLEFYPDKNDPDFKLGYSQIKVNTDVKNLNIKINTEKEKFLPGEDVKITFETSDNKGNKIPANLSVAVVDESVLALLGNPEKNILDAFYSKKGVSVSTADNLVNMLKRVDIKKEAGAKGGGGGDEELEQKRRGDFRDTAYWLQNLDTDENGEGEISFTLPDNLTTWQVEAVGATKDTKVGMQRKSFISTKNLIVRPVYPRFFRLGDSARIGAIVNSFLDDSERITTTFSPENLEAEGDNVLEKVIENEGREKFEFKVSIPNDFTYTSESISVRASAQDGKYVDTVDKVIPIVQASAMESAATLGFTQDASFRERVIFPPNVLKNSESGIEITVSPTLFSNLDNDINLLVSYPYGCSEQTASGLLSLILSKEALGTDFSDKISVRELKDENGKIISPDEAIDKGIQRLYKLQRYDGGWGFWEGSDWSYPHLSTYILFTLEKAKALGATVDEEVLKLGKDYVNKELRKTNEERESYHYPYYYSADERAFALFVLSEFEGGDLALSNNLFDEDLENLNIAGKSFLLLSLHNLKGDSKKIEELKEEINKSVKLSPRGAYFGNKDNINRYYYGSRLLRSQALQTEAGIYALSRTDKENPFLPKLVRQLLFEKDKEMSTHDTAFFIFALSEYSKSTDELNANYAGKIFFNSKIEKDFSFDSNNIFEKINIQKNISELEGSVNNISFAKEGDGRIYYEILASYAIPYEDVQPFSEGFSIEREFFSLEDEKEEEPLDSAKEAETIKGRLTIVVPEKRSFVAVECPIPAGTELVNLDFATEDQTLSESIDNTEGWRSPWNHKELRDDRLFLFSDYLPEGSYTFEFLLRANIPGDFKLPPAKVFEMYFPENFGRTGGGVFEVN